MRFLPLAATALVAACVLPAAASADSVVYAKGGNLFLTSPDGAKGYQLTADGGYSSPSQADDGTIGAVHDGRLVRLDRSGRVLSEVDAIGSPGSLPGIAGPYEARLSPDGRRFAYWFFVQTSYHVPYDDQHRIKLDTGSWTTWTWADRFTDPSGESGIQKGMRQPDWLSDDRVVGTEGFWMNMWTWKLGGEPDSAQYWFGLQDPADEWGVEAYHWYDDPAVSRDGAKLAMTDGGKRLMLAATHGPAYVGDPPYEIDYLDGTTPVAAPTLECAGPPLDTVANPSWSADGRQLAYGAPDGVRVMQVPGSFDCGAATEAVIAPGGTEPAFGPADVELGDAPTPRARVSVRRAALRPRAFRAARGSRLRFTLSAPARVTLAVRTAGGRRAGGTRTVAGRGGVNRVRFRARGLRPGRYRVTIAPAGGTARTAAFTIVR